MAKYFDEKRKIYDKYNITPRHIAEWGEPAEFVQGFMLYIGNGSSVYPSVRPKRMREREGMLSAEFVAESLSEEEPYKLPTSLEITDFRKQPFLVDFKKELRCSCEQKNQIVYMDTEAPCHHEIAVNIWCENMLKRYTKAKQSIGSFRYTYDKTKKYVKSKASPWYINDTIPSLIIDEFMRMKKKRVKGLELTKNLCNLMNDNYNGLF